MDVSRFVGVADARRVAAWWDRWSPERDPRFTERYAVGARMQAWLGIASYTRSPDDALRAQGYYRAWSRLVPASLADDVEFYGDTVKGARRLAGLR